MVRSQVECLCSSALSFQKVGSSSSSDDSEFFLFLFLEQCGSRRLFRTVRPNFVQVKTLSLSSVLQRKGNTPCNIWEPKYLNHKLLLDFFFLQLVFAVGNPENNVSYWSNILLV